MGNRVGINGFGRIGRQVVRAAKQAGLRDIDFVAVNDLTDTKTLAHLFKYDSVHRTYRGQVSASEGAITIDGMTALDLAISDNGRYLVFDSDGKRVIAASDDTLVALLAREAPARTLALSTSFICWISAGVAARWMEASPMTNWRSAQCPTSASTLTPRLPRNASRYCPNVVKPHFTPAFNAGSVMASTRNARRTCVPRSSSSER